MQKVASMNRAVPVMEVWPGLQPEVTGAAQVGHRNGRRLAIARSIALTIQGNWIFGISLVASTVP